MKKIIYVDMDDVIADFQKATRNQRTGFIQEHLMWDKDFFLNLDPVPGAKSSVYYLDKMGFDIWILSQPLAGYPESYLDKAKWVQLHFPQYYKKLILTQDKSLNSGEYLIDDNKTKWQQRFEQRGGKFIHFNYGGYNGSWALQNPPEKTWEDIVQFFYTQNPNK